MKIYRVGDRTTSAQKMRKKGGDIMLEKMKKAYQSYNGNLKDDTTYKGYFLTDGDNVKMIVREFFAGSDDPSNLKFFFKKGYAFEKIAHSILENNNIKLGKNTIKLDNGDYLINWYGKYNPQMSFLVNWDTMPYFNFQKPDYDMNIEFDGDPYFMYGKYWVSRKGKHCFRPLPKERAEHMLVKVDWEKGLFRTSYGKNPELKNAALYYHRARSKGGGIGNTYYVLPKGYVHEEKLEDYLPI